ncbi:Protein of unknown function [Cotesia congregata]|uniref:Uncharacterized protein n=1 Tax=Cotesia congregata TaxID=51543 RepID=A0A8J2MV52_COTCN|nr:Protein of unknown function [Cotesia congregata]
MRLFMLIPCLIVAVNCHPLARDEYNSQASGLALIEENNDAALRSKRTVGVLRQFFPEITEMIDNIVNKIVSEVIKVVGPTVIQDVLGGNRRQNNGNSKTESEGSEVTIEVPADFFEDSESDSDVADINNKDNFGKVNIPLPTFETTQVTGKGIGNVEEGLTTEGRVQLNYLDHYTASNRRALHQDLDIAESENKEVRVAFDDSDLATNEAGADLTSLDNIEIGDDENRNKRFSGGNGESGGSGGGSGNFIFDIIRRIAATSERFVNFKARLITSII